MKSFSIFYIYAPTRPIDEAEGIMFSGCPSVCGCVRPSPGRGYYLIGWPLTSSFFIMFVFLLPLTV